MQKIDLASLISGALSNPLIAAGLRRTTPAQVTTQWILAFLSQQGMAPEMGLVTAVKRLIDKAAAEHKNVETILNDSAFLEEAQAVIDSYFGPSSATAAIVPPGETAISRPTSVNVVCRHCGLPGNYQLA